MFEQRIDVIEAEIDALDHVSNIAFVQWIQDVAVAHSTSVGLDMPAYFAMGAFFVVRRHEIDYLRPALRGDSLVLRTWIASAAAAKCERATEVVRSKAGAPDEVLARATTTWGYIEARTLRPARIPDSVRVAFGFPPRVSARPPRPIETS
jgi:acyl-CoA thioester hydrolase